MSFSLAIHLSYGENRSPCSIDEVSKTVFNDAKIMIESLAVMLDPICLSALSGVHPKAFQVRVGYESRLPTGYLIERLDGFSIPEGESFLRYYIDDPMFGRFRKYR